ncbi:hypothetical protein RGI145_12310 [Roseomonas gilardii]|uniref:Uncharacterized protein n=1 Tax=Roseomonas gilardii TaxID=257708 RepID=A0A1L7AG56_9PROT|nr:hypothetical protein [Roseomonas gilardii]APT57777.1 hypothetical protein RGI145_12310 [Roseomonas gilardii]
MPIASDGKGNWLSLNDGGEWVAATRARNPETGAELILDGQDWKPLPAPTQAQPSVGQQAARGLGLGVRDVIEGAAAIPGMIVDAAGYPVRAGLRALGYSTETPTEALSRGLTAVGLPEPSNSTEQAISGLNRGAVAALPTMGAGMALQAAGRAPIVANALADGFMAQGVGGAAGGLAQDVARQNDLGPAAEMGAALVGGAAGAGAVGAAQMAGRGAVALAQPFTRGGREAIVNDLMLRSSARPETLPSRVAAGADPIVPGSVPTTAEAARDSGLSALQRGVQGMDPATSDAFALRDASRDAARRAELAAVEPDAGGAAAAAQAVRTGVAQEEARFERTAGAADARLRDRLGQLPDRTRPEEAGQAIRETLSQGRDEARAVTSRTFEAIDPEGVAQMPFGPIQQAAREAEAQYFGPLSGPAPAALRGALDDVQDIANDTMSWRAMQNLRSRLGTLAGDPDPRVKAVAGQIRAAIDDVSERAAQPFDRPSRPRGLADIEAEAAREGAAQHPDVAAQLNAGGLYDPTQAAPVGRSLVQWLRANGGLRDDLGDLGAVMGGTSRTMPGLWSHRGMSLDEAAQRAFREGYLEGNPAHMSGPTGTSGAALIDAIEAELRGAEFRYPGGDVRASRGAGATAADDLAREVEARGGQFVRNDPDATLRSLHATPENGPAAGAEVPERFAPIENAFTPEQAEAWRAAQQARAEQGRLYDRGATRRVLDTRMGQPVTPASQVPGVFFGPNSTPENIRQVLEAAGDRSVASRALEGYAATSLRDYAARPDGTLDPTRWRAWMQRHEAVLAELPELRRSMASVGEAAATVDRVAGLRKASMKEIETGAARYFLGREPDRAMRGVLASGDPVSGIRELRRLVGNDPQAVAGLRRAYLDEWLRKATTTTLDAQGEFRLSPAMAQRFFRDNGGAARELFGEADLARMRAVADDMASSAFPASAGKAAGSNTYQNLSTGNFIARMSNGTIDPNNAIAQALGSGFGVLQKLVYAQPEMLMRDLLREAMLDPKLAADMLSRASPASIRRAMGYVDKDMAERAGDAVRAAVIRGGARQVSAQGNSRSGRENPLLGGRPQAAPRNSLLR